MFDKLEQRLMREYPVTMFIVGGVVFLLWFLSLIALFALFVG